MARLGVGVPLFTSMLVCLARAETAYAKSARRLPAVASQTARMPHGDRKMLERQRMGVRATNPELPNPTLNLPNGSLPSVGRSFTGPRQDRLAD
jgi:hypothetical protein